MRSAVILLLLAAVATPAAAQRAVDERFAVSPTGFIRIHSYVGSVKITGWSKDSVVVTGTVSENAADRFEVHGGYGGTKMGFFGGDGTGLAASELDVRVPTGSQLWVKTASADIFIGGVAGGVDVYSVSGRIEIAGRPREVFVESMGGRIAVEADTRTVRAKSASGDIEVRGAIDDVIATTVSGTVTAEGSAFERGRFESVDGDIRYFGTIPRGGWLDFINHAGAVELLIPRDASAEFELTTFEGAFDDRFGVELEVGGNKLKGQRLTFTLGRGGAHVTVRNFKGRTVLRAK